MHAPTHGILSTQSAPMSTRRMMIVGSVALLHALLIYAIVSGMAQRIVLSIPRTTIVEIKPDAPPKQTPPPPPKLEQPTPLPNQVTAVVPDIAIATDQPTITTPQPTPQPPTTPTIADADATGLTGTHTTPPYPPIENKLGHQGTVVLQLLISAEGAITSATVVQSSGFPALDQEAVAWVQANWRYKPAIQNGTAVPSQTRAAVKFDLHNARG